MPLPRKLNYPNVTSGRLVTKTSLPNPKKAIALLILMWYQAGKPGTHVYGKEMGTKSNGGILSDDVSSMVVEYAQVHHVDDNGVDISMLASGNPLVEAQIESLNAAFELIWHMAKFRFADAAKGISAERTGGFRYQKQIEYTCNMDIIDMVAQPDEDKLAAVLCSWLSNGSISCDAEVELRLTRTLAIFAETSYYKSCKGDDGVVYATSGIYDVLVSGEPVVDLVNPGEEAQGPTRILKAAIKDGLNPLLVDHNGSDAAMSHSMSTQELTAYKDRAEHSITMSRIEVSVSDAAAKPETKEGSRLPNNLIYFGAPGTGKSYNLNERAGHVFKATNIRRVTFHPDYTYAQFVGCYRPGMDYHVDEDSNKSLQYQMTHGQIVYKYTAGPFVDSYIQAMTHPEEDYLLIIEEINRANPAAVFGDIFQLLDRDSNGVSEYPVRVSEDLGGYLIKNFVRETHEQHPRDDGYEDLYTAEEGRNWCVRNMRLPGNLYIWATMNSADQGVFPMDTAFKRRWEFEYLGIDEGSTYVAGYTVGIGEPRRYLKWDELRRGINAVLKGAKVNEDKLLGPFFIQPADLNDPLKFSEVFKSKVLLYLYEDAAKMHREKVFSSGSDATYSEICDEFDRNGEGVFKDFDKLYHKLTVIAEDSGSGEDSAEDETEE